MTTRSEHDDASRQGENVMVRLEELARRLEVAVVRLEVAAAAREEDDADPAA